MTARRLVGILGAAIWGTFGMMPAQASAAGGDPAPQDIRLGSAGALVDICTVEPTHDDYAASLGFTTARAWRWLRRNLKYDVGGSIGVDDFTRAAARHLLEHDADD